jgi:nucleotide-binding universal stress UspA family protein
MLAVDNILVARDFSAVSDRALRYGLVLAAHTGATLHVLHAEVLHSADRPENRPSPMQGIDALRTELHERGAASAEALDAVSVVEVVRRDVTPAPALLSYAAEEDIDLIAMGTHGRRGPSRILLGSVAEEVVRRAEQPVLTIRGKDEEDRSVAAETVRRILVPVDFSDYSREALRTAHEWAALYDAELHLLHVVVDDLHPAFYVGGVKSIYDAQPNLDEKVHDKLGRFATDVLGSTDGIETHVDTGSPASAIAAFATEHDLDLVTLSTHGRTGLERFFLGSVTEKVVRHVSCPVLTVKAFGTSLVASTPESDASASVH